MINSSNQKSFCAGGDVKSIVLAAKSKDPIVVAGALKFFETEYQLNHLLATLKKPVVSVLDGSFYALT